MIDKERKPSLAHRVRTSPNHHTRLAKHLKRTILLAIAGVIVLGAAAVYLLLNSKSPVVTESPQQQAVDAVTGTSATTHTVTSSLGFSLYYSGSAFDVEGQVTDPSSSSSYVSGNSYSGNELKTTRAYSLVKFTVPESKNGQLSYDSPELTIYTNIRKDYWSKLPAGESQLDFMVSQTTADQAENGYVPSSTSDIVINNVTYHQVTYTHTDNSFGITTTSQEIYYFTVQNDRPYFVSIGIVNDTNNSIVTQYQSIVKSLSFAAPADGSLSSLLTTPASLAGATVAASTTADALPSGTSNIPTPLNASTIIKVAAANQPAVVRIGTGACAQVQLLLPDGSVGLSLGKTCAAEIGSGSFVSSDGYIATNGHVTRITPEALTNGYVLMAADDTTFQNHVTDILRYLIAAGLSTSDQAQQLLDAYNQGDQTAQNTISSLGSLIPDSQIKITDETYQYAIQTSDEPMKYDFSQNQYKYTDTVIPATFIAANVDEAVLEEGGLTEGNSSQTSTDSDVSILKAKGTFPIVHLGSIDQVSSGSELTAIGFPAFVDGGLNTTKSKTVPSVTQGTIEDIGVQSAVNSHVLLITTVPIAEGNSGGPSFDDSGNEIGLNTYGDITCPDTKCFGDGIVRDIADYKALLSANGITLNTNSAISSAWTDGLTAMEAGNYVTALSDFQKTQSLYPANYLASSFISIAQTQVDIQTAARNKQILTIVLIIVGVVVAIGIVAVILLIVHLSRHKQPPAGGTPPPVGGEPVIPSISAPTAVPPQLPPQQNPPSIPPPAQNS